MRPLVLIPTYNERDNLRPLVAALMAIAELKVLVVDDNSPDGTADEAEALAAASDGRVSVMRRAGPRGLRPLVHRRYGRGAAHRRDAHLSDRCGFFPRPRCAAAALTAATAADLVIGSRYVPGGELRNWPAHRLVLSRFANWYIRAITRLPVHDCTSGFRCWTRGLLARMPLDRIVSERLRVSWWKWPGKPTPPAVASSKSQSRLSSGVRVNRRCRAG